MPVPSALEIKQVALEIYGGCNFKCPMCPQSLGRESEFLSKLSLETYVNILDDAMQYGLEVVSLQGSGEPTLHPEFPEFVRIAKKKGLTCISLTNGFLLTTEKSRELIDAGLDVLRVSAIGYDRASYAKWMSKDCFAQVREHVIQYREMIEKLHSASQVTLYHLIADAENIAFELDQYKTNWIEYCHVPGEVWMMHNWSGVYADIPYKRLKDKQRSCGRPNAPHLTVRAGGIDGHKAAVVPCCYVLGQDSKAVLGHLDTETIADVVSGQLFTTLRDNHDNERFGEVDYCKDCDQLYDCPETLVWTNIQGKQYGQSKFMQDLDFRTYVSKE